MITFDADNVIPSGQQRPKHLGATAGKRHDQSPWRLPLRWENQPGEVLTQGLRFDCGVIVTFSFLGTGLRHVEESTGTALIIKALTSIYSTSECPKRLAIANI